TEPTDAETLDRDPRPTDEAAVRWFLRNHMPAADGPLLSMRICMYTNTPDHDFIIDRHPGHPNVTIACGFSGHGFKCASAIGEALAELATVGRTTLAMDFLSLKRFATANGGVAVRKDAAQTHR
ncbi:MAG: N-methyl-L-tryptophan oxidase, partial [Phycisphaerales bacterium]|nr:N-methyl-L-tryptophan oxidase [Phycisphaerales bacterium]